MFFLYKLRMACRFIGAILLLNGITLILGGEKGRQSAARRLYHLYLTLRYYLGTARLTRLVELCQASGVSNRWLARNPESGFILSMQMMEKKKFHEALEMLSTIIALWGRHPGLAKCYGARANVRVWLGEYDAALVDLAMCKQLREGVYVEFSFALTRAFINSQRGEYHLVREALAERFAQGMDELDVRLPKLLYSRMVEFLARYPEHHTIGVMFGNYDAAVGHAILDPYHTYQLYKDRFDHILLIHPPLKRYARTPWLAVQILHQYLDQMETDDPVLLSMAWQYAGELKFKNVTFLLNNYWSLNRAAALARQDPRRAIAEKREYFQLPPRLAARARAGLPRKLSSQRPIIVVHMREHGFHNLSAQSFRNVNPMEYVPALRWLVQQGYQVVRIGDSSMTSLRGHVRGLFELPLQPNYDPVLDLYLLQRCRFMISCQSGPCSFARVFGKPNLVLNAVYHYTLLPEHQELFGFKDYIDRRSGASLSVEEIFRRGGYLFDRSIHFETAGIELREMSAEEILAAVQEMDEWIDHPDQPETENQEAFRRVMHWFAENPIENHPLWHPHADYIGYGLPEGRVLDSLCRLRPGYLAGTREAQPAPRELVRASSR